jgi:DNA-directed RNA polymerase III subunit RPC6
MALQVRAQDHQYVQRLLYAIAQHPDGITVEDLERNGFEDKTQIMEAANFLSNERRIDFVKHPNGQLAFLPANQYKAAKFKGLDPNHVLVYQEIEKVGNQGCWSRTLKDKANLDQHTITKITKELLRRQLIKEVKSVQNRSRKVLMLFDVEPATEVSGGTWYHEGEFAIGWVETLRENCLQFF